MLLKTNKFIIFAGYRDWASKIFVALKECHNDFFFIQVSNPDELSHCINNIKNPIVILAGWSWIIDKTELNKGYFVGLHPSDLPNYAGGTPLQHQIIDDVEFSKMSLFEITSDIDYGPVLMKCDLSLTGEMYEIFERLAHCGLELLKEFLFNPDMYKQNACFHSSNTLTNNLVGVKQRLKPSDSALTKKDLNELSSKELYNFIRARGHPYPNAYLEDDTGRLYFRSVKFEKK